MNLKLSTILFCFLICFLECLFAENFLINRSGITEYKSLDEDFWSIIDKQKKKLKPGFYQTYKNSELELKNSDCGVIFKSNSIFELQQSDSDILEFIVYLGNIQITSGSERNVNVTVGDFKIIYLSNDLIALIYYDIRKKLYINIIEGSMKLKSKKDNFEIDTGYYYFFDKDLLQKRETDISIELLDVSIEEKNNLRDFILRYRAEKPVAVISAATKEPECKVVYYYPKPGTTIISDDPYGMVVFNNPMNTRAVENSIFEISSGSQRIRESIRNLIFLGYITTEWSDNNKTLLIKPNKSKLVLNRKYYFKFLSNAGMDIYGNKLETKIYEGQIEYKKR